MRTRFAILAMALGASALIAAGRPKTIKTQINVLVWSADSRGIVLAPLIKNVPLARVPPLHQQARLLARAKNREVQIAAKCSVSDEGFITDCNKLSMVPSSPALIKIANKILNDFQIDKDQTKQGNFQINRSSIELSISDGTPRSFSEPCILASFCPIPLPAPER